MTRATVKRLFQGFLILASPTITIAYAGGEYFGLWDRMTGRDLAMDGLRRLRSTGGFPTSYIYNDPQDRAVFIAVERRISEYTTDVATREALHTARPTLIATAGSPIRIDGVPPYWPQEARFFFSNEHPVLYVFGAKRGGGTPGNATRACTLAEIEGWLTRERDNRRLLLGGIIVALMSGALAVLRQAVQSSPISAAMASPRSSDKT